MFKQKLLLIAIILLSQFCGFGQSKYLYYFDANLNLTDKANAVFSGVGAYENGSFELMVYNQKNNWLFLVEHFTDSTLATSNGLFSTYYVNKAKEWEGNYLQGKQNGLWRKWNMDGKIIDSSLFDNGEKIMQANFTYYYASRKLMTIFIDSFQTHSIKETYFDESGKIISEDENIVNHNEDTSKIFIKTEIPVSFPGGATRWQQYITKAIQKDLDNFTKRDYGTCLVRFIVDKTDRVSFVEAMTMKGTKLAEIAVNAIKQGPNWTPAQVNGHLVNAYRLQPVTLQRPNE